jgi:hypothetical protein
VCTCEAGTFWNKDSSQCELCPENHFSGRFSTVCSKCPFYMVSNSKSAGCMSCPKGYSWADYACTECPENLVGNGVTCISCPEGTSPSDDKTFCQEPFTGVLSEATIAICALLLVMAIGNIIFTWKERRVRIKMSNQVKVRDRKCTCSSCPRSDVSEPAQPKRGTTMQ